MYSGMAPLHARDGLARPETKWSGATGFEATSGDHYVGFRLPTILPPYSLQISYIFLWI
jgi:hypothetical protein